MMNSPGHEFLMTICPICSSDGQDREIYPANFKLADLNPQVFSARRLPDRLHYRMVVCRACLLMRANPVLNERSLSFLYEKSHGHDHQLSTAAAQTYLRYFKNNFSSLPMSARILEIGCGTGAFLKNLLEENYPNVHGVEPSFASVEQAGEIKGLIYNGMFKGGIYPNGYFDIICAFQVFDHLADPLVFLKDCCESLKPEGKLFFILHNRNSLPARILGRRCPMVDIEHPFLYDTKTIVKIIEANGFTVQKKFSVLNHYPLRYWLQLMPLDMGFKKSMLDSLQHSWIGNRTISLGLGNMGIIAQKK